MKSLHRLIVIPICLLGLAAITAHRSVSPPHAAAAAPPFDTTALEASVRDEMRATRTPGVAVAIVLGDSIVYAKGFGVASIETGAPVTPDMVFRVGSVTKMFTGLTAVMLANSGRVDLSAPIGR